MTDNNTVIAVFPDHQEAEAAVTKLATARLLETGDKGLALKRRLKEKLIDHRQYIRRHGQDMPEIRNWRWGVPQ